MSNRTFYASTFVVADGVTRTWPFSFAGVNTGQESGTTPYLYPTDVKVQEIYTDSAGNKQTMQRTGTINSPNQITIDGPAIIAGREIRIYRETELRFPLVDYRDLQSVSEHDLDLANRQAVFIAQETRDTASANLLYDAQGHFNAGGRRIVNMAPGIDDNDAVNMSQHRRTLRVPMTDPATKELPAGEDRKYKILSFDINGDPVTLFPPQGTALELEMALYDRLDPTKGAERVGYRGTTVRDALSWVVNPRQFFVEGDTSDLPAFKRMHAMLNATVGRRPLILLTGAYNLANGLDPRQYEWSDVTMFSSGAVLNINALSGDNGVFQIGNGCHLRGHYDVRILGTGPGGNGFVRTAVTAGRWWDASFRVRNWSIESINVTTSTGRVCVAVSGSACDGSIGSVKCFAGDGVPYAIGVLVHWSGLPNDITPTVTYHPHNINIGNVEGDGATEALLIYSAAFAVNTKRLAGSYNATNFLCIAGDWGARYATPSERERVGTGLSVDEFAMRETTGVGVHIVGQPGLTTGYRLDFPVILGTGTVHGGLTSTTGMLHSNVNGGVVGTVEFAGFANGIAPGAFVSNVVFNRTRANRNRGNGIRVSGVTDPRTGLIFDHVEANDNNISATGGVAQIEIGNSAVAIELRSPRVRSNNTQSQGIHLSGSARNCVVDSPTGTGFNAGRFVVLNDCSSDSDNIVRNVRGDFPSLLTPSSTPVLIRIDLTGVRVFASDGVPTKGTFAQGDIVEFTRTSVLGYRGAVCHTPGTPGVWYKFGKVEVPGV